MKGSRTLVWPPQTRAGYGRIRGLAVYSADGQKVGIVTRIMHPDIPEFEQARGNYVFIVDSGLPARWLGISLLSRQLYVPERAIQSATDDRLVLEVSLAALHEQDWSRMPDGSYIVS